MATAFNLNKVPLGIAAIALLAFPFAYAQANIQILQTNPMLLLAFGVAALSASGFGAYFFVFRHLPKHIRRSPYLIFFAIFAFAAILDLQISLTLMGFTEVMRGYLETGEPYLQSSHGMAVNFWDGTVHLSLYIWMSFCLASAIAHRRTALFWAGSMVGSCLVYMLGNLIGEYAEHIEPSYLLNVPFFIVPVFYAWKVVHDNQSAIAIKRPIMNLADYALAAALLSLAAFCVFRLLVVLNPEISLTHSWAHEVEPYLLSDSRYPQLQMLVYGLYLLPFCVIGAMSLWRQPSRSVSTWAWIFTGLVAQGQFAHIVASIDATADPRYTMNAPLFWSANLIVLAIPIWFAWRYEKRLQA